MEAKRLLMGLGIAGIGYYFYRQYQLYKGLQFGLVGVGFDGSISNPQINLRISLNNPTGVTANLQGLNGSVYADGLYIAKVTYESAQIIQPYDRTLISLNVRPVLTNSLRTLLSYISQRTVNFNFRGGAVVDNIPVPFEMNYTVGKLI